MSSFGGRHELGRLRIGCVCVCCCCVCVRERGCKDINYSYVDKALPQIFTHTPHSKPGGETIDDTHFVPRAEHRVEDFDRDDRGVASRRCRYARLKNHFNDVKDIILLQSSLYDICFFFK